MTTTDELEQPDDADLAEGFGHIVRTGLYALLQTPSGYKRRPISIGDNAYLIVNDHDDEGSIEVRGALAHPTEDDLMFGRAWVVGYFHPRFCPDPEDRGAPLQGRLYE